MGRRKNNPELVEELIDGIWSMDQDEFEEKYYSLSRSDMSKVSAAIDGMEDDFMSGRLDYEDDYDDDDEGDVGCAACGNPAYPNCKTSCPLFDD